jgi:hypothetical protein
MTYENDRQVDLEQFFTAEETAEELSQFIKDLPLYKKVKRIIEPSAGDGVWLEHLPVSLAYDLEPKAPAIIQANYLETEIPYEKGTLFVGNPPFGKRGNLARQFINKAATEGDWIAFVLPASFGKRTLINGINPNLHLIHQLELFGERFRIEGGEKRIRCVFQIWERRETIREKIEIKHHTKDFTFTTNPDEADFCLVLRGFSHGKVKLENFHNCSLGTHTFVKLEDPTNIVQIVERLEGLPVREFSKFSTNQPSISTAEIVELYEKHYGDQ